MPAGAQSQTAVTNSTLKLRLLADVDAGTLADGSMIQYSATSDKFVVSDEISTTTGSITLNGGSFERVKHYVNNNQNKKKYRNIGTRFT